MPKIWGMNQSGLDLAVPRLLVVEDDATLCRVIERSLNDHARVDTAQSGVAAQDLVRQFQYSMVACDIDLPDVSGLEVITTAREVLPAAGIVAITGMVDVEVAVGSMRAGADDFLAKPFDPSVLWHVLQRASEVRAQRLAAAEATAYRALAYTDALTESYNRRYLDEFLAIAIRNATAMRTPLTVAFVDLDNFKLLNDALGHAEGDRLLQEVARALSIAIDGPATFGRYGGDEFVVVLPGMDAEEAAAVMEGAREACLGVTAREDSPAPLPLRLSFGLAMLEGPEEGRDLIGRAENAMYLDKAMAPAAAFGGGSEPFAIEHATRIRTLRGLTVAIDRRDAYTRLHSDHTTRIALALAREVGLDEESINGIMFGGPIHDLGKIAVPDDILRKPGALSPDERRAMEMHPVIGAAIASAVLDLDTLVDVVRHHHERFDGEGYPAGLRREQISLATRLFSLCDAFSAMTTDRPYRAGLGAERALAEIRAGAGRQFDPDLAPMLIDWIGANPDGAVATTTYRRASAG